MLKEREGRRRDNEKQGAREMLSLDGEVFTIFLCRDGTSNGRKRDNIRKRLIKTLPRRM